MVEEINDPGSPGSRLRNWQPGDDDSEELEHQKISDALQAGASERQMAKRFGASRMLFWRARMFAAIPVGLFERLITARVSHKTIIHIGRYFDTGKVPPKEFECCPNCGYVLRDRNAKGFQQAYDIWEQWNADGNPD